jgi:hypothetical protein
LAESRSDGALAVRTVLAGTRTTIVQRRASTAVVLVMAWLAGIAMAFAVGAGALGVGWVTADVVQPEGLVAGGVIGLSVAFGSWGVALAAGARWKLGPAMAAGSWMYLMGAIIRELGADMAVLPATAELGWVEARFLRAPVELDVAGIGVTWAVATVLVVWMLAPAVRLEP